MAAKVYDFEITQQETADITQEFYDDNNLPRALTGNDFKLDCKLNPNLPDVLFTMTTTNGDITIDGTQSNKIHINFTHNLTKGLNFPQGYYDLIMFDGAKTNVEVMMTGTIKLNKTITKLL